MSTILQLEVAKLKPTQDWIIPERLERAKQDFRPIEVWPDLSIKDGHHRWTLAKQRGQTYISGIMFHWPSTPRVRVAGGGKTKYVVDVGQGKR